MRQRPRLAGGIDMRQQGYVALAYKTAMEAIRAGHEMDRYENS